MSKIFCFDIDGTICSLVNPSDYTKSEPYLDVINEINRLYDEGNKIIMMTARGSVSKRDWSPETVQQLDQWGVKYHELIMNKKPHADFFIDDKGINAIEWRKNLTSKNDS